MGPEALLEVAKEIVAIEDAKGEHMKAWPEWWAEPDAFAEGKAEREPNRQWSAITERSNAIHSKMIEVARAIVAAPCAGAAQEGETK